MEGPQGIPDDARSAAEEIVRRGRRNEDLGDQAERWRRRWVRLNYLLGVPSALLAGISGVWVLNDTNDVWAGILALSAAGLAGVLAYLNPTVRVANANVRANAYWEISHRARFMGGCTHAAGRCGRNQRNAG